MRYLASVIAMSVALLVFAGAAVTAQTASPAPLSKRALRQQDREECSRQVTRYQADKFLECMANRQAARKAGAKKKAAEELPAKREKAAQDFKALEKARVDWNKERLALIAQQRAKRADCKAQAKAQNLHYAKRLRFFEQCIAAK
ncbi:MAG TPA: hypothetical protein VIV34_12210 [Pseudolabrys sp.]